MYRPKKSVEWHFELNGRRRIEWHWDYEEGEDDAGRKVNGGRKAVGMADRESTLLWDFVEDMDEALASVPVFEYVKSRENKH